MPSVENPPSSSQKAPRPPLRLSPINPRSNPFRGRSSRRGIGNPCRLHRRRRLDGYFEVLAIVDNPQKTGPHPDKRQRPCLRRNAHANRIARFAALKLHFPRATSLVNVEAILLGHRAQPPESERPAHPRRVPFGGRRKQATGFRGGVLHDDAVVEQNARLHEQYHQRQRDRERKRRLDGCLTSIFTKHLAN